MIHMKEQHIWQAEPIAWDLCVPILRKYNEKRVGLSLGNKLTSYVRPIVSIGGAYSNNRSLKGGTTQWIVLLECDTDINFDSVRAYAIDDIPHKLLKYANTDHMDRIISREPFAEGFFAVDVNELESVLNLLFKNSDILMYTDTVGFDKKYFDIPKEDWDEARALGFQVARTKSPGNFFKWEWDMRGTYRWDMIASHTEKYPMQHVSVKNKILFRKQQELYLYS